MSGAVAMAKKHDLWKQGPTMKITVKPYPWDLGPRTEAQIDGKVVEEVTHLVIIDGKPKQVNPNEVICTRRENWINRYHRQGKLSDQQFAVALELLDASLGLATQDPLAALRIDGGRAGSDPEAERVDRRRKFRAMWALVPGYARPIIEHVVVNDGSLRSMAGCRNGQMEGRHLDRLQRGLHHLHEVWSAARKRRVAQHG
jgi:hypothetical protein